MTIAPLATNNYFSLFFLVPRVLLTYLLCWLVLLLSLINQINVEKCPFWLLLLFTKILDIQLWLRSRRKYNNIYSFFFRKIRLYDVDSETSEHIVLFWIERTWTWFNFLSPSPLFNVQWATVIRRHLFQSQ